MPEPQITPPQTPPKDRRPKMFPPPEFPPRKAARFARTPPAVFPAILGLLGLGLALRRGLAGTVLEGPVEALNGALLVLWAAAAVAMLGKIARRPGVVFDEMKPLPGRAGLAAAVMSLMAAAGLVLPYAPGLALAMTLAALGLHLALAVVLVTVLLRLPPEAREVNPAWHLAFVGFILAGPVLVQAGWTGAAQALLFVTMAAAALIWGISLAQLLRRIPPAPLRPLLAIHLAPASLFATVAALLGQPVLAQAFAAFGAVIFGTLLVSARWITAAGFSPLWGAFTFPMTAFASALILTGGVAGGVWGLAGLVVLVLAAGAVPAIGWNVLKLWPGGRLAAKTNAAEA